jgi:predicted ATPase/class 3 adenylate cyclase
MRAPPSGTVAFLFTDIEQSTRSWEDHTSAMEQVLSRHDAIIRSAIDERGGYVFSSSGDGFGAVFGDARDAADVAVSAQRALARERWSGDLGLRVRMGVHTGEAQERDANYFGPTVNRAARVMDAAHGGQILLSNAVAAIVGSADLVDLGLHWLRDLPTRERLWHLVTDPAETFPPPRSLGSGAATNLPPTEEELLGRSGDFDAVRSLLAERRLLTIVGVGGIGKTRLALDVAASLLDEFDDGVWWCELAPVGEEGAVAHAVGRILGARQHPGRTMAESVAEFCRRRRVLLVLDNCEHVLDAAGELVEALANAAPQAFVLATSREAIGCRSEQTYPLASLGVEGDASPSFELFLRRAAEVMPHREWDADEKEAIRRICQRLDGMPLAIELAAGRVRSLSPVEIERRLGGAFRTLRGGRRSLERHRTLAAAIDWSYYLLDDASASLFERLSVFAGGWDLQAAEAVCADAKLIDASQVADLIDALVVKSLVVADHGSRGTTRYRLLEPLRQYAEDRLAARGEAIRFRDAHADYFTRWAATWMDEVWSDELGARIALEAEFANLRTAVAWAIDANDADRALRAVTAVDYAQAPFLMLEIGDWAKRATDLPAAAEHPLGPDACRVGANSFWWRGDLDTMAKLIERGESMKHYDASALQTNQIKAMLTLARGDPATAFAILDRIEVSDPRAALVPWWRCALHPAPQWDDVATLRAFEASTGSTIMGIMADQAESSAAWRSGDRARAAELTRRAIARAGELGARYFVHLSVGALGVMAGAVGKLTADDLAVIRLSLREQRDCGAEVDQWLVLSTAAVAMLQYGKRPLAVAIYRGLHGSPWSASQHVQDLGDVFFGDQEDGGHIDDGLQVPSLATLVDAVMSELDALLAEPPGESTNPSAARSISTGAGTRS